jgi:hypothetical protein
MKYVRYFGIRLRQHYQFLTLDFQLKSDFLKKERNNGTLLSTQDSKLFRKACLENISHSRSRYRKETDYFCTCIYIYTHMHP